MTATFRTAKKFLMWIGNLLLILLTEQILLPMLEDSLKNIKHDKSEYCSSWGKKIEKKKRVDWRWQKERKLERWK